MAEQTEQAGTITTAQAAKLLKVTEDWVRQLSRKGYIPKAARGRFNLVAVVHGYIAYRDDEARRTTKGAAESRVRDARAAEIERRMAREDREIIALEEAAWAFDKASGEYLRSMSGLPARITRNPSERRRIEIICDSERARLEARFGEIASSLRAGGEDDAADDEDDA